MSYLSIVTLLHELIFGGIISGKLHYRFIDKKVKNNFSIEYLIFPRLLLPAGCKHQHAVRCHGQHLPTWVLLSNRNPRQSAMSDWHVSRYRSTECGNRLPGLPFWTLLPRGGASAAPGKLYRGILLSREAGCRYSGKLQV